MKKRLAIVTTHPIQYNAPAFRALSETGEIDLCVFYEWEGPASGDAEFGRPVEWDIPLLDGYDYRFVPNVSANPGTHQYSGIDNPTLPAAIETWRPDAILLYGWSFKSHVRILRRFHHGIPILFRGDSTLLDERGRIRRKARRIFLRWIYSHVDHALYPGAASRDYFLLHGLRGDEMSWAPHAVDNHRFASDAAAAQEKANERRLRLGIQADDIVLLFSGKLSSRKDPELLLRCFSDLNDSRPGNRMHLVFAGDGELADHLSTAAAGRANVHFTGFHNQSVMPIIYRVGDVLVMPSRFGETWGLAVNEAMACGRPTIVSDRVGCGVDLVHEGITGFVFEHGNVLSLAAALRRMPATREKLQQMGAVAAHAIEPWSIAAYVKAVTSAVSAVAARPSASVE